MLLHRIAVALALVVSSARASSTSKFGPSPGQIKNLVVFGDSYSDVVITGDNGTAWPIYAAGYGPFNLFPYARSGAVCSNNLTNLPFPSLMESQLPLYLTEVENGTLHLNAGETIYTLWIGTNDVGSLGLLTGNNQTPGVTLVDVVACAVSWVKILYESGARNFLFQNMIPLQQTVLYSPNTYSNPYNIFEHNATEWSLFISELTTSGNALAKLMLQDLVPTLPKAHIGLFDSHALFSDIISHPTNYLNGTALANVVDPIRSCFATFIFDLSNCTFVNGTDRDSYLWFDELHPSEQTDRVVAREITDVVLRKSERWVIWLS